jgi:hypothetical protein
MFGFNSIENKRKKEKKGCLEKEKERERKR